MAFKYRRPAVNKTRFKSGSDFRPSPEYPTEATPNMIRRAELLNALLLEGHDVITAMATVNHQMKEESLQ